MIGDNGLPMNIYIHFNTSQVLDSLTTFWSTESWCKGFDKFFFSFKELPFDKQSVKAMVTISQTKPLPNT